MDTLSFKKDWPVSRQVLPLWSCPLLERGERRRDSVCTGVGVYTWVWECAEAQTEPGWGPEMLKMKAQREH